MNKQSGFTVIELLVVIFLVGIISTIFSSFFIRNMSSYTKLQNGTSESAAIAARSQRVASVLRATTSIVSATSSDLVAYAYFYPSDSYVSLVHYYMSADKKKLYSDVTPMTSNPPIGTPITSKLKTYTIASDFYLPTSGTLFDYLDANDVVLAFPISDLNAVKLIRVNIAIKDSSGAQQDLGLQVQLRNRKTNL